MRWLAVLLLVACDEAGSNPSSPLSPDACVPSAPPPGEAEALRPRARPIENVGLMVTKPIDRAGFLALAGPLFGAEAAAGQGHQGLELEPGLLLTVEDDPRTDEQVVVRLELVDRLDPTDRRPVARLPVSLAHGELFIETVKAALRRAGEVGGQSEFWLEYRARSPEGGSLDLRLDHQPGRVTLSLAVNTPSTSLEDGRINTPAFSGLTYETLAGTVWFELSRDEFDFFVERAYGITRSAGQNFKDFQLQPHNWLRLTVTPELVKERVDVAFEVLTEDGRRLPLARSPASYVAGDLFKRGVLHMVDNMLDQEAAQPGSSTPWVVPFHYDDPQGGGVVRVVAQGQGGTFRIAYAVESPIHPLEPVEFLPYVQSFEIPEEFPEVNTDCAEVGSEPAAQGHFAITFDASSTVRGSRNLDAELRGPVWGAIYKAADVTITGPRDGAESVAGFFFEDVDLRDPAALEEFFIDTQLPAGTYQILGFIDIDQNASDEAPDVGDPVTVPIGAYPLACARQPVRVEFAILRP